MKTFYSFIFFYCFLTVLHSQPFSKIYSIHPEWGELGYDIISQEDGFLLRVGFGGAIRSYPEGLIKTDKAGEEVWKNYHPIDTPELRGAHSDFEIGADGNIWFSGQELNQQNLNSDYIMVTDPNGIYKHFYHYSYKETSDWSIIDKLIRFGNYFFTIGAINLTATNDAYLNVRKVNLKGEEVWVKRIGKGHYESRFLDAVWSPDSALVIAGFIRSNRHDDPKYDSLYMVKIDTTGNLIWEHTLLLPLDRSFCRTSISLLHDGGYAVGACIDTVVRPGPPPYNPRQGAVLVLDSLGKERWRWYPKNKRYLEVSDILTAQNGDIVACGAVFFYSDTISPVGTIMRFSPSGEIKWMKHYIINKPKHDFFEFFQIIEEDNEDLVAVGGLEDGADPVFHNQTKVWLLRVDSMGCITPGCDADTLIFTPTRDIDGTTELAQVFFTVYPNPVIDLVNITFLTSEKTTDTYLTLRDINGKSLVHNKINNRSQNHQINMTGFPAGIYLLSYEKSGKILQSEKIVKLE